MFYLFLADLALTLICAFFFAAVIEIPFSTIVNMCFGKKDKDDR